MPDPINVVRDQLVRLTPPPPRPGSRHHKPKFQLPQRPHRSNMEFVFMGIFSRTRDIVAANFTDLLDKAEDPAKMIRMIIMEMEETLVEVRASAARTIADQKEMRRQISKLDKIQEGWTEKAELALSKDREDLAKAALVEKRKAGEMADQLRAEIQVLDDGLRASEEDIAKLQGKLREARTRQNAIVSRLESAQNRAKLREMYSGPKGRRRLLPLRHPGAARRLCRRARRCAQPRCSGQDARGGNCRPAQRRGSRCGAGSHEGSPQLRPGGLSAWKKSSSPFWSWGCSSSGFPG
jgi:phage shock protein A